MEESPQSLQRARGPAAPSILDFWPLELGDPKFLF